MWPRSNGYLFPVIPPAHNMPPTKRKVTGDEKRSVTNISTSDLRNIKKKRELPGEEPEDGELLLQQFDFERKYVYFPSQAYYPE